MFVNRKGTGALWGGGGTTSRVKVTIRYTVTMCFQGSCQDCHGTRTFRDNPYTEWKIVKRGKRAKVKWNYLGEVAWPECIENPWETPMATSSRRRRPTRSPASGVTGSA